MWPTEHVERESHIVGISQSKGDVLSLPGAKATLWRSHSIAERSDRILQGLHDSCRHGTLQVGLLLSQHSRNQR